MRPYFATIAAAATVAFSVSLAPGANAMLVRAVASVQQGLAETNVIEQVRTVCRLDQATNRTICWIDRSQPPTVCHWVRDRDGNLVRDCY
jgi:hypothetical protein